MVMRALVLALGCSALTLGCGDEAGGELAPQQTIDNLLELGVAADGIQLIDHAVFVGGDAEVSLQASRELLGLDGSTHERWRHPNLVAASVTNICVNGAAFTGVFSTALNGALASYNALGLRFRMTRTTGNAAGCNALITARHVAGFGRSSGFPANGLPFPTLNLGSGFISFDVSSIRYQILHLLGHCVGLGHADAENPDISCGPGSGAVGGGGDHAPVPGVGLILIPGAPVATIGGSVMNTCYRAMEPGQLTPSDRGMLNVLY
jgi:hypothetical protein